MQKYVEEEMWDKGRELYETIIAAFFYLKSVSVVEHF